MKTISIPLGEWLPDAPDLNNPGLTRAHNVYPSAGTYAPFPGFVTTGTTVTGTVIGARLFRRSDGTYITCVGTASDLYVVASGTANASSLSLTVASGNFWQFEQFGPYIIAVCPGQTTYYLTDVDSDIVFSALTGSPPEARTVNRVGDFLMLGNIDDGTAYPYRIQWSAYNNPTASWTTNVGRQSGFIDMDRKFGEVTLLAGGRYDMVFQRHGVSRIEPSNGPTVFNKRLIDENRGCIATPSGVAVGTLVYFLAHDGFCVTDGNATQEVGNRRVNDWFFKDADLDKLDLVQGAVNWKRKSVVWSYVPSGETTYQRQMIYSWQENRWATADVAVDWLVESNTTTLLVDNFETVYGNTSMDDADVAAKLIDSEEFQGIERAFGAWAPSGANSAEGNFEGAAREAILETGEFQPSPGMRSFVSKVRPMVENAGLNTEVSIGSREQFKADAIAFTNYKAVGPDGGASVRSDGRYQRVQLRIPAGAFWNKASAFEADFRASGRR